MGMKKEERKGGRKKKKRGRERENNASFRFVPIGSYDSIGIFQISSINRGETNWRVHKSGYNLMN